jgi:hypothetical protein
VTENEILRETKLPLLSDYVKANCTATDGSHYKNVHAGIRYAPEYHEKIRRVGSGLGLDILILGFHSLSHMTYRRQLTKTYTYFTENLKGIVLSGYNIVGDDTPKALYVNVTRCGKSSAHAVTYPFLRKSFQIIGYTSTKSFLARRFSVLGNSSSVLPAPEYHEKIRRVGSGLGLDILILGFHSLSHMTYRRKLSCQSHRFDHKSYVT